MPRLKGGTINIGGQLDNYFYIDYTLYPSASTNSTYVTWAAGFKYTLADARLDNGDVFVEGAHVYDVPGAVKSFNSNFTTRDHQITSGNFTKYHAADGTASITFSGGVTVDLSPRSSFGTQTITLENFDRSPVTPTISSITRASDGASITAVAFSGGANNSGPTPTYTFEYSTSSSFTSTSGSSTTLPFSLPSATTSYYFRIKASNADGTKYSAISSIKYGVPGPPTFATGQGAKTSSTISGSVDLSWTAPSNTQTVLPAVPTYDVYRDNVKVNTSPVTGTTYSDTGLVRGTLYNYNIVSVNNVGYNPSSSKSLTVSATASGVPAAPSGTVTTDKVGRNVTVSCQTSPNDYGNVIVGYRVQYSTDEALTWSEASVMTNRSYKYELLPAALTYVFRCYAINSIGNGDTLSATPIFVSAGGRRKLPGGDFEPTQTAKRYDSTRPEGQRWVDLNTAKRYSSAANDGLGGWIDLS